MGRNYEQMGNNVLVCRELTVLEAAAVVDQSISCCLRCSSIGDCNPRTMLTVERLRFLFQEDSFYSIPNKTHVMFGGRLVSNPDICKLSTLSLDTERQIDLMDLKIPDPISSGR